MKIVEAEKFDKPCPNCGRPMTVKNGRRGRFVACTGYPDCKTALPYPIGVPCPSEGCAGELVERQSARGQTFYSCNNYPECKFSISLRPYSEEVNGHTLYFVGTGEKKRVLTSTDEACLKGTRKSKKDDDDKDKKE